MIYNLVASAKSTRGLFALLIDPDKHSKKGLSDLASLAQNCKVDLFLLGGSLIRNSLEQAFQSLRSESNIPIVLFPGHAIHVYPKADAILLLSLISGRNPEFLIGNHVVAAHSIKDSGMEVIPTGYILINCGEPTSVQYMSNTTPIPLNKPDIAVATAIAGEQLGLKAIYLEGGSGANTPVPPASIREISTNVELPIIVGGGLKTPQQVRDTREAGASMVVVGNAIEHNKHLLSDLVQASR